MKHAAYIQSGYLATNARGERQLNLVHGYSGVSKRMPFNLNVCSADSSEPLHLEIEVLPTHKHAKEVCMLVCKLTDNEIPREKCHPQEKERKRAYTDLC